MLPSAELDEIDRHLDGEVSQEYKDQPLAQDWARVSKVVEEAGEAINELILYTGQNPRKRDIGFKPELEDLLGELADTAITALLAMTHFTKSGDETLRLVADKLTATWKRIDEYEQRKRVQADVESPIHELR